MTLLIRLCPFEGTRLLPLSQEVSTNANSGLLITEKQISKMVKKIVAGYHPIKIFLFGSYAYGNPTPYSDVDLLIIKDSKLNNKYYGIKRNPAVTKHLKDIPFSVDTIVRTSTEYEEQKGIEGSLIYIINKYGKVLYDKTYTRQINKKTG